MRGQITFRKACVRYKQTYSVPMANTICGLSCNFIIVFIRWNLLNLAYWLLLKFITTLYCVRWTRDKVWSSSSCPSVAILFIIQYVDLVTLTFDLLTLNGIAMSICCCNTFELFVSFHTGVISAMATDFVNLNFDLLISKLVRNYMWHEQAFCQVFFCFILYGQARNRQTDKWSTMRSSVSYTGRVP